MPLKNKWTVVSILLLVLLQSLTAQENTQIPEGGKGDQGNIVKPLTVAEIVSESENTLQTLTKLRENAVHNPELDNIKLQYENLHKQIENYKEKIKEIEIEKLPVNRLNDLRNNLEAFNIKIKSIQEILSASIANINSSMVSLKKRKLVWDKTYQSRFEQKIPEPLVKRIRVTLKFIREVQKIVNTELDVLLNLQSAVSNDDLYVKERLLAIKAAEKSIQKKIFQFDSPPIWEISLNNSLFSEIKNTVHRKKDVFLDYYKDYTLNFEIHLTLFLFMIVFTFLLFLKVNKNKINEEEASFARVLTRYPISATLLITFLFTPVIHPHAPSVVGEINRLILLAPVVRLVPLLFLRNLKNVIIAFLFLFMLYALSNLLISDPDLQRIIISFLIFISLVGLVLLNRKKLITSKLTTQKQWITVIRAAFYLGIVLVIVSLVAIIFGAVNFAKLLFGAELKSAYLAVVVLTGKIIVINIGETAFNSKIMWLSKFLKNNKELIIKRFITLVNLLFIIVWFIGTLSFFGVYDWLLHIFTIIFTTSASIGEIKISLGAIISFALAVYLTFAVSRLVRAILEDDILPHVSLPKGVPSTISTLTHYLILTLGFFIAISAAGMNWSNLAIIIGSLGVGIGFGLQNFVNNFVSGLILIFERPVSIGDVIEVGNLTGTVKRIGIRSSTIRTFQESEVIVPNGLLISQELINWTLSDRQRRLDINVGVAYGTDPLKVMTILQEVAEANPQVRDYPKPFVTFEGFGDSSLDFLLRIWAGDYMEGLRIKTKVTMEIYKRFNEENIEIPFPQRDIHIIPQKNKKEEEKGSTLKSGEEEKKNIENIGREIEPGELSNKEEEDES